MSAGTFMHSYKNNLLPSHFKQYVTDNIEPPLQTYNFKKLFITENKLFSMAML